MRSTLFGLATALAAVLTPTLASVPVAAQPAAPQTPNVIRVDAASLRAPQVLTVANVVFDSRSTKVFGNPADRSACSSRMTSQPIAAIDVLQDDVPFTIDVHLTGERRYWVSESTGFFVGRDGYFWSACGGDAMHGINGGWKRGRYFLYPTGNAPQNDPPKTYEVRVFDPQAQTPLAASGQHVVLDAPLAQPKILEVHLQPGRRALDDSMSGSQCHAFALPGAADIVLDVQRPLPGLTVRQLPSDAPAELRVGHEKSRWCVREPWSSGDNGREHLPSFDGLPSLTLGRGDEGVYQLSFGTKDPAAGGTIKLMIYDDTTVFSPFEPAPPRASHPDFGDRWVAALFPQLDVRDVAGLGYAFHPSHETMELATQLWKAMPADAFIYTRLDLDKSLVYFSTSDELPKKNEKLVLLEWGPENRTQAVYVMSADGNIYRTDRKRLVLAPEGEVYVPPVPRPFDVSFTRSMYDVLHLLPKGSPAAAIYQKKLDKFDACLSRAWEPYGAQLPQVQAGYEIAVKSPRYVQIEDAGRAAQVQQCGTRATFDKAIERDRAKLMKQVDAERVKLLASATSA